MNRLLEFFHKHLLSLIQLRIRILLFPLRANVRAERTATRRRGRCVRSWRAAGQRYARLHGSASSMIESEGSQQSAVEHLKFP
jgi:hypothetical protein